MPPTAVAMNFEFILIVGVIGLAYADLKAQNPCDQKSTCRECIRTPTCAWCYQQEIPPNQNRCFQPNSNAGYICNPAYIFSPDNEFRALKDKKLTKLSSSGGYGFSESGYEEFHSSSHSFSSSISSSSHRDIVQVTPQEVKLKLRINEAHRIKMHYSQSEAYPVDLYYLMDLSKSMEDDKKKLSDLGTLLAETMKNITTDFRLGFGSFVDKVVMPYVSVVPDKLKQPCTGCEAPYGFMHQMPLSVDTGGFSEKVKNASVSGNLDAPEGGFDAIMQAIVCREQIGWREKARRLLVFSTDAGFHYAGDGKLGGIVKPNDGLCHLDSRNMYTHSTIQDYPSVSQINTKVIQNSIHIIFAVTKEQSEVYEKLSHHIEGAKAAILAGDSSNIVELLRNQYDKISSSIELKDTASSHIKVDYYTNCLDPNGPIKQRNKCDGLKVDSEVAFQLDVKVAKCPENKADWVQTFSVYPVGLNESLTVHLEMLCDCPCEHPDHPEYEKVSDKCSGSGTYECGICSCDESHFGENCECNNNNSNVTIGVENCKKSPNDPICSGNGECICGQCQCNKRSNNEEKISGKYCECDNFSCEWVDGKLCGGPLKGECVCGECQCKPGWSGSNCDCATSTDTCKSPVNGLICSGHGECECGVCKCKKDEASGIKYSGKYCDRCPTCPERCAEFQDCVKCQVHQKGPLSEEECASNCTTFTPLPVDSIELEEEKDEIMCSYIDDDDCRYTFTYYYDSEGNVTGKAKKTGDCPAEVYMLAVVVGVIGAIVLIGLAFLLLWKMVTTIQDRREFAKFQKESQLAKWDTVENPIYKQATSTFQNPLYKK